MTTKQEVNLAELIELTKKSVEAIKQDILNSVFNVEFQSNYPYEEEKKINSVGDALLKLEQNQEKLKVAEALLDKYISLRGTTETFLLEKE